MVVSAEGFIKTVTNTLRILGTAVCFIVFLLWAKLAAEKLVSKPISSTITYKNGDDGKGLIEHPIVTICPANLKYFTLMDGPESIFDNHCSCGFSLFTAIVCQSRDYVWGNIFKDCFGKNGFKSVNDSTKKLDFQIGWLVRYLKYGKQYRIPKNYVTAIVGGSKEKKAAFHQFFHESYGTCWSFDSANEIKPFVDPEEMTIEFRVGNRSIRKIRHQKLTFIPFDLSTRSSIL